MDIEFWRDGHAAANSIRLLIIFVGFTLAMMCFRFGWLAWRRGDGYRVPGILCAGMFIITPSVSALGRFDENLYWPSTVTYVTGLVLAIVALWNNYRIAPEWARLDRRAKRREEAQQGAQ